MTVEAPITAWKFLRLTDAGKIRSGSGKLTWTVGTWKTFRGTPLCCVRGLHASPRAVDALRYVPGEILAQVECAGAHDDEGDKSAWQRMRIVKAWRWNAPDSVALAVYAAELVLPIYEERYPDDSRPAAAIEAAKAWLTDRSAVSGAAAHADDAAYASAAAFAAAYTADAAIADAAIAYAAANVIHSSLQEWMTARISQLEPIT
jgi:hypothetical protein